MRRPGGIPDFDSNGNLPPGIYHVSMAEIERSFTWNETRRVLFRGFTRALANLSRAGVRRVWIDGSFVTSKDEPQDVDGGWEPGPPEDEDRLDAVFLDLWSGRQAMRRKYGVDFLVAGMRLQDRVAQGRTVEEFFQADRRGNPKGILLVEIGEEA